MQSLEGKGIHYFAKRVEDFRDRDVVIVGGGDSAVDWAMTLEPIARHVTVIHRSKFRAHEATVKEMEASRVELRYPGCEVVEVHAGGDRDALLPVYDAELVAHQAARKEGGTASFIFRVYDLDDGECGPSGPAYEALS